MAHLVRAEFGVGWLVPRRRLDGWQTRLGVGYEQYLFLGPGLSWAVVAVHWLSMGLVSVATAFKAVVIGSFAALPLAVAFLARSLGLGRRAAGLAAVLSLCVSPARSAGPGSRGRSISGWCRTSSAPCRRCLRWAGAAGGRRPAGRWVPATAAALAAVLVSHAISAIILATLLVIILPTLLATDRVTREAVGRLATTVGLAGGLAAFWLVPVVAHRGQHGMLTSWANPPLAERLADILGGQLLFRESVVVWFLLAGWRSASPASRRGAGGRSPCWWARSPTCGRRTCSCAGTPATWSACSSPTEGWAMPGWSRCCRWRRSSATSDAD
jgi:hypothetical protein